MKQSVMKESIETLLSQVSTINKKYEDIAKATGENFNVFSILGLSTSEVKTHSRMIAELLNPYGSHDMGDVFLKLFIEKLISDEEKRKKYLDKTSNAKVVVEKFLGNKNEENYTGGYIDILIEFPNSEAIIVENKINAIDQEAQLRRYYNYNTKAELIYLTLEGGNPSDNSTLNKILSPIINLLCLSYKKHIIEWLEYCKKEAVNHPLVRETITQYIYLIKRLTHQAMNEELKKEIVSAIIESPKKIETASKIHSIWDDVKQEILNLLKNKIEQLEIFGETKNLKVEFDEGYVFGKKDSGFWVYKSGWKYCIYFVFWKDYEELYVTIDTRDSNDEKDNNVIQEVNNRLSVLKYGQLSFKYGFWYSKLDFWTNTEWENVLYKAPNDIENVITEILSKLEGIKM